MCLNAEAHNHFIELARALENEKLLELDKHYRNRSGTSVEWELHGIVMCEIHRRRQEKRDQLEIALWHSSKRGKAFQLLKQKLINLGIYNPTNNIDSRGKSLLLRIILRLFNFPQQKMISIWTLPGKQTALESL